MKTLWLSLVLITTGAIAAEQTRTPFSGIISVVDVKASMLTVQNATATREFKIGSDTIITTSEKSDAKLSDLNVGDRVNVSFTNERGTFVAHRIECTSTGEIK